MMFSDKMRNLSVTTFIHILFSVAIVMLISAFLFFLSWDKDRQKIEEVKRYQLISITFLSNLRQNPYHVNFDRFYKELKVSPIADTHIKSAKEEISKAGKTIFTGGSRVGQVRVFAIGKKRYIYIQRMGYNLLLEDDKAQNFYFEYAVLIGILLIALLLILYLAVLKKLSPLKKLHRQIQQFARGDMQTRITYMYDDEIGKIAKSFDDAIIRINTLSTSKNLFMRNLMHELKTPITKGRIVVEMLENEQNKEVLVRAFERMNELISELAALERVTTQSFEPNFEYVMLLEIIKESQELLMTQSSYINVELDDISLTTDKKLMVLAVKNLIDNGIKYGTERCVTLQNKQYIIEVISSGEPLKEPLSYYTEPFSQAEKRSSGFGLGLYIVSSILEKLGYRLDYQHVEGHNIFSIALEKRKEKRN